jgi:hypothetical protein
MVVTVALTLVSGWLASHSNVLTCYCLKSLILFFFQAELLEALSKQKAIKRYWKHNKQEINTHSYKIFCKINRNPKGITRHSNKFLIPCLLSQLEEQPTHEQTKLREKNYQY